MKDINETWRRIKGGLDRLLEKKRMDGRMITEMKR